MLQFFRLLMRHWLVFTASVVLVVACSYAATAAVTPVYAADVKLFVSASSSDPRQGDAYSLSQFVGTQVQSIATLATTPRVTDPVAAAFGLKSDDLAGKITASVPKGTVFVDLTVRDTDRALARDIANGVADRLPIALAELESSDPVHPASKSPLRVTVVERAVTPTAPVSPHMRVNLVLGALLGIALGSCLALLRGRAKLESEAALQAPTPVRPRVHGRLGSEQVGPGRLGSEVN